MTSNNRELHARSGCCPSSWLLACRARESALKMCADAGAAHIGSALSVIDILAVLYSHSAEISPSTVDKADRDVVVVSKGHAAAGVYAILAHAGYFPIESLHTYCADGSLLSGHVNRQGVVGVELSTGSLGHGLPFGCGFALGRARKGMNGRVFVVMSDGELDEGSTWEAALLAAHNQLSRLVAIVDRNGIQSLGPTESTVRLEPLAEKWRAFGWHVISVDGHDHAALTSAFEQVKMSNQPSIVLAATIKGKGVPFMEHQNIWHYQSPSPDQLAAALAALEGTG